MVASAGVPATATRSEITEMIFDGVHRLGGGLRVKR